MTDFAKSIAADAVSGLNIILEFSDPADRPTYIGLTNTLLAPSKVLAPIIGGWLATWLGYPSLFLVALSMALFGCLLLGVWLREPRAHAHPTGTAHPVQEQSS